MSPEAGGASAQRVCVFFKSSLLPCRPIGGTSKPSCSLALFCHHPPPPLQVNFRLNFVFPASCLTQDFFEKLHQLATYEMWVGLIFPQGEMDELVGTAGKHCRTPPPFGSP